MGRLVVEYMEQQLQGEGARGEAARVQKWNLQISVHWMMYVLNNAIINKALSMIS